MRPRYLTAFEHEPIPIEGNGAGLTITSGEADYLSYLGELRPGFCERGHHYVRLAQYCGVITLGDRILEILPKIDDDRPAEECRGVLVRLLREAKTFSHFQYLSVGQHLRRAPLLDVFIAAFFDTVTEIIRGGLLRQYQERDEDLQVIRGRILTSRQFAVLSNRPDRLACRFDELTGDNVWNRLIKAGIRAVRPWITSVELSRRWIELMVVFDEVDDTSVDATSMNRLMFDRHAVRYRMAIDWVRWILALLSPALRAGQNEAPGLLFDMNQLFQSAIAMVLRRRCRDISGFELNVQETGKFLARIADAEGRRACELKPDLVLRRGSLVVAVGDTKWKRLGVSRSGFLIPKSEDMYQMHAYAAAFECEHLALIYPSHSDLVGGKETTFELPAMGSLRPLVSVICVDLHSDGFRLVHGSGASAFATLLADSDSDVAKKVAGSATFA